MPCCKNAGGGPGDDDQSSSRLPSQAKWKRKVTTMRKRSRVERDMDTAIAAAEAAGRAERGGRSVGLHIRDSPACTEATEAATEAEAEESTPGSQEEQQLETGQIRPRRSTHARTQVTSPHVVDRPRCGACVPP
jgi:hypothetical protein